MSATRRMMMMDGKKKEYVSVFKRTFPGDGAVSGRNSFFIYLTETVTVGTKMRLAMSFTATDATLTQLGVHDSSASPADVVILMPQDSFDVEFEISDRNTDILWCYFDKNATGVQIDMQTIKVDKVI